MISNRTKAFTLIELMAVIFIIGILSAVAIPLMRGKIDTSKWSEGKAMAGTIRTVARSFCVEKGPAYNYAALPADASTLVLLGFVLTPGAPTGGDFDGKYFKDEDFVIDFSGYNQFVITVTAGSSPVAPTTPAAITLDQDGFFSE